MFGWLKRRRERREARERERIAAENAAIERQVAERIDRQLAHGVIAADAARRVQPRRPSARPTSQQPPVYVDYGGGYWGGGETHSHARDHSTGYTGGGHESHHSSGYDGGSSSDGGSSGGGDGGGGGSD